MIHFFAMDVDGTLTDGKIYMGQNDELIKAFNIKDGYGIRNLLASKGIIPIIITGRCSNIVLNRCKELGITEIHQGVNDKTTKLKEIVEYLDKVAYIGDDINDLSCMEAVKKAGGLVGCPADAVDEIKKIADYIAYHNGGDGAVRDFIDWIIS